MYSLSYNEKTYDALNQETVLDCLLRNNEKVMHSCKSGVCQSCILKTESVTDPLAQKGFSSAKKNAGLFLSCQQKITKNFKVYSANELLSCTEATISSQERVSESVVLVGITFDSGFEYHGGQFVNLVRNDGLCRSYSLASRSSEKNAKLHVRKVPNGKMSSWLYDCDLLGEKVQVRGPAGECYLNDEMHDDDLLLIGIGTGLAPLFGIIQDYYSKNLKRKITLFHSGFTRDNLYLVNELKAFESMNENFTYRPTYFKGAPETGYLQGDLVETIKNYKVDSNTTTVMVCGDPEMVKKLKQEVFLKGVSSKKIFSDPFVAATNGT